jgi:hypothetical protein
MLYKRPVRLFVSYARADRRLTTPLLAELKTHFRISRRYRYEVWQDIEILRGEPWRAAIERALRYCQVGLLLESPKLLASDFVPAVELPRFIGKPAIPVGLKPMDLELHDHGALVIFDGLDEALVHLNEKDGKVFTRELLKLRPLPQQREAGVDGRLLISCRTHYFRTLRDEQTHFGLEGRDPVKGGDFRALVLLPFDREQIAEYFRRALPERELSQLLALLREFHDLEELAERPYTLSLIAQHIPRLEAWRAEGRSVTGASLYGEVVQEWLERDAGKHVLKPDHKARLMEHLADAM